METKSALNLHGDGDSLLALVRAWNTHDADGHPFLETFAKDLRWLKDQPPRAQVLTLCQAVEGAHDHTHAADVEQQQTQYTEKRQAALDAINAAGIFHGKDWKFVKGSIPPRAPSNLRTPLHWTASVAPGDLPARAAAIPSWPRRPRKRTAPTGRTASASSATTSRTVARSLATNCDLSRNSSLGTCASTRSPCSERAPRSQTASTPWNDRLLDVEWPGSGLVSPPVRALVSVAHDRVEVGEVEGVELVYPSVDRG